MAQLVLSPEEIQVYQSINDYAETLQEDNLNVLLTQANESWANDWMLGEVAEHMVSNVLVIALPAQSLSSFAQENAGEVCSLALSGEMEGYKGEYRFQYGWSANHYTLPTVWQTHLRELDAGSRGISLVDITFDASTPYLYLRLGQAPGPLRMRNMKVMLVSKKIYPEYTVDRCVISGFGYPYYERCYLFCYLSGAWYQCMPMVYGADTEGVGKELWTPCNTYQPPKKEEVYE